jgi:Fe-S-cluster containining protein
MTNIINPVRFSCKTSGKCCTSHGQYGYVFLTKYDVIRFSKHLDLKPKEFKLKFCKTINGVVALKDKPNSKDCQFLKERQCSVYKARPLQCRTWPFWPENMNAKTWNKEIKTFCPGIGEGKLYFKKDIQKILLKQKGVYNG